VSDAINLVSGPLRRRLLRDGASALSDAEWHLLRVSHLMKAAECGALARLLADTPVAELLDVADGLDAIGTPNAGARLRTATEELTVANDPGHGLARATVVTNSASLLGDQLAELRPAIEHHLLEYAVRQREHAAMARASARP
jgi:hypothetical protein